MNTRVDPCATSGMWSIPTAFETIVDAGPVAGTEMVPLSHALGRVTASAAITPIALPRFDQSAMDGYGIHRDDVATGGTGPFAVAGSSRAGHTGSLAVGAGTCVRLLTGARLPDGVAAVVMEVRVQNESGLITLHAPVRSGENIRRRGEDVAEASTIVASGQRLDARHIALLAATGCSHLEVRRRIRVGILSTGDELTDPGEPLEPAAVYDSNRPMLAALLSSRGVDIEDLGQVTDDVDRFAARLVEVHPGFDLIVTSGGVSGSDADHSVQAIRDAGGVCTRIALAMKPGKPIAFGAVGGCRVLSLPGNPVAAMVGTLLFVRPLLEQFAGARATLPSGIVARTATAFFHRPGRTEFVPVAITGRRSEDGALLVEKLGKGGSARLAPLVAADGLAVIAADSGDLAAGEPVTFHPFRTDFGL